MLARASLVRMSLPVPVTEGPVAPWLDRAIALAIIGAGSAVILALARVVPDPRGYGTHEQLGMSECGWPQRYGMPCPTCGVTTAACYLVHLSPWRALVTQPFGAALAATGLLVLALALVDLVRGRSFVARAYSLRLSRWVGGGILLLLAAWGYKASVGV